MNFRLLWTRYPFPFKGALWVFWLLVVMPFAWAAALSCTPHPEYFYLTYPVAVVLACLWEAHARQLLAGSAMGLEAIIRMAGRAAANLLVMLFFSLLLAIPVSIFLPAYQCYSDRAKIMEMLLTSSSLRTEITQRLHAEKTVEKSGVGLQVKPGGRVAGGLVAESGVIILVSEEPPAVVMLTPKIIDAKTGESQWVCSGFPEKIMPASCRREVPP